MTTVTTVEELLDDLAGEHEALDAVLAPLAPTQWALPTPSRGWSVADQIGHLTYFDSTAATALRDADAFRSARDEMLASAADALSNGESLDSVTLGQYRAMVPAELLSIWRAGRTALLAAARAADPSARVPWYGPDMSVKSFLTARLMETYAHGQDVVDAVGAVRPVSARLRHVAQIGFITRGWSYLNRGLQVPDVPVRVSLTGPAGERWTLGPDDAVESVEGPAEDFALVVTQRRNVADTALVVTGDAAAEWMSIAQAFAGGATEPPAPAGGGASS